LMNEKLVISERLKSNFLSNIRNEINNPIASVLEMAKMISMGNATAEQMKKFGRLMYGDVLSLDFQLRNILASAEFEAGDASLNSKTVNIEAMINNVKDTFLYHLQKKNIELNIEITHPEFLNFYTDPEKLHLVLANLVSNAIQFNKENGKIWIKAGINGEYLSVSVRDTGMGINKKEQSQIFDRFRQLAVGSTKAFGGHGLGLCITKSLLDLLNGSIWVSSQEGEGSEFRILILGNKEEDEDEPVFSSEGNDFLFVNEKGELF